MTKEKYQQCARCLMDTSADEIVFDQLGICNFCTDYTQKYKVQISRSESKLSIDLDKLISEIKTNGVTKQYDCIIGVSGGIDSSWALVKAVQLGLRPLAVHMDNGWNSEAAQNNISNLVEKLGVDLFTYVIEWEEYRNLMLSFLNADVIDVELLYDNAMLKVNYQQAAKFGVKYILSGSNFSTEGIEMPENWNWLKYDGTNIKSIAGSRNIRLKSFPLMDTKRFLFYNTLKKINWISFLDYFEYDKESAIEELENTYSYKRYPYKHYESIFTRFYQAVILPEKFGVDKRIIHLSNLVISGQMQREQAVELLSTPTYPLEDQRRDDRNYFIKKVGWSEEDYADYFRRPPRSHRNFASEERLWKFALRVKRTLQKIK